jgi:hypothetical protein
MQSRSTSTCSAICNNTRDQCINDCGPGPDHLNNPNWLSCRHSCRDDASSCRESCSQSDDEDNDK